MITLHMAACFQQGLLTQRTGQLLEHSSGPSTVGDSAPIPTTPVGEPFLDIQEYNQSAEEALQIVEDMGSQDRTKNAPAMSALAKYRGLAAAADGAQPASKDTIFAKAIVQNFDDLLATRKNK